MNIDFPIFWKISGLIKSTEIIWAIFFLSWVIRFCANSLNDITIRIYIGRWIWSLQQNVAYQVWREIIDWLCGGKLPVQNATLAKGNWINYAATSYPQCNEFFKKCGNLNQLPINNTGPRTERFSAGKIKPDIRYDKWINLEVKGLNNWN